jgi:hypothetical protein
MSDRLKVKLQWNQVAEDEWQAGSCSRFFIIEKNHETNYVIKKRVGDHDPETVTAKSSLEAAQEFCEKEVNQ